MVFPPLNVLVEISIMSPIFRLFHHFNHPFQIHTFFPQHPFKNIIPFMERIYVCLNPDPNALLLKKLFRKSVYILASFSQSTLSLAGPYSLWDFSGGPVVGNLPCNTENVHLIPGRGAKTPYVMGQPNPHTTNTEPMSSGAQTIACEQQWRFCCYS